MYATYIMCNYVSENTLYKNLSLNRIMDEFVHKDTFLQVYNKKNPINVENHVYDASDLLHDALSMPINNRIDLLNSIQASLKLVNAHHISIIISKVINKKLTTDDIFNNLQFALVISTNMDIKLKFAAIFKTFNIIKLQKLQKNNMIPNDVFINLLSLNDKNKKALILVNWMCYNSNIDIINYWFPLIESNDVISELQNISNGPNKYRL